MSFINKIKNNPTFKKVVKTALAIASAVAVFVITAIYRAVSFVKKPIQKCAAENAQKG